VNLARGQYRNFEILARPIETRLAEPVYTKRSRANQPGFVVSGFHSFTVIEADHRFYWSAPLRAEERIQV
jgi:hypothetical protein